MWYSADLASFLFKCAWKTLFLGFRAEILLLCAEILPLLRFVQKYYWPGTRGSLDSRAGPFLGSVKKYWFSEKYSPLPWLNQILLYYMHLMGNRILWYCEIVILLAPPLILILAELCCHILLITLISHTNHCLISEIGSYNIQQSHYNEHTH